MSLIVKKKSNWHCNIFNPLTVCCLFSGKRIITTRSKLAAAARDFFLLTDKVFSWQTKKKNSKLIMIRKEWHWKHMEIRVWLDGPWSSFPSHGESTRQEHPLAIPPVQPHRMQETLTSDRLSCICTDYLSFHTEHKMAFLLTTSSSISIRMSILQYFTSNSTRKQGSV